MKKMFANRIFQISLVVAIVFLAGTLSVKAKNTNTTINNNIRSSANTGSSSEDNVETGSASAQASVKTETSGTDGETSIKTNVSAEANGKKVEINTESSGGEDVNIQKEITEDGASASVDVQTSQAAGGEKIGERQGVVARVTNALDDAIESFFRKIFSIFS